MSQLSSQDEKRLSLRSIPICAFCDGSNLELVMDFGHVAIAGRFLKSEAELQQEHKFPLRVSFCQDCYAVQVIDKIPPAYIFHQDYFYFSSSIRTLQDHFRQYAAEVTARFLEPSRATVLEFGCNDGVLLIPLADQGIRTVIGVDPIQKVVARIEDKRVNIINDFFNEQVAAAIIQKYGKLDMIVANNVFAHIEDIQGVTRAIANSLKQDGVFIFEVHYLGKVINEMQYDMIYHEHLYYYSLLALMTHFKRHEMMIFDVKQVPVHAGSVRFYACKQGSVHSYDVSTRLTTLLSEERAQGFDRYAAYQRFSGDVKAQKEKLMSLLVQLRNSGYRVVGYGASGRANTMIQYCGISHDHIEYVIDDAPAKEGCFTPGSHFNIFPRTKLLDDVPDYILVFAWSFFNEICQRNKDFIAAGGKMILPLPNVAIYSRDGLIEL